MSGSQNRDMEVPNSPTDGISALQFSPQADILAATSWDNNVRLYEIQPNGTSVPKAMYSHDGPALCCSWSNDGTKLASGGADKIGKLFDMSTSQATQFAQHDAPIKEVRFIDQMGVVATGSWDKTIKYWDLRQQTPVTTVQLPERVYAMDFVWPLLVVGTAERKVLLYNLSGNPSVPIKTLDSPLKWQTRTITCFPTGTGYAIGSIEGRVAIQNADEKDAGANFSFRCHRSGGTTLRDKAMIYSVNAISFHPVFHTFTTAGADGGFVFWDKDSKQKLKQFDKADQSISATCYNRTGTIFAYAVSYDWNQGHTGMPPQAQNKIMLHAVNEVDVKPRKR